VPLYPDWQSQLKFPFNFVEQIPTFEHLFEGQLESIYFILFYFIYFILFFESQSLFLPH